MTHLTYTDGEPVQVGDRVTAEGVVTRTDADSGLLIVFGGDLSTMEWLDPRAIASHSSPPIKAGDKAVHYSCPDRPLNVIAVCGPHAWVERESGALLTVDLSALRRVTP